MSPLNASDALYFNCIHFLLGLTCKFLDEKYLISTDVFHSFQKMKGKKTTEKQAMLTMCRSRPPLSPGSSDALSAVIHTTVLTCEQGRGVLLPFPASHHSGPKVCLDMPFPAPLSPATPSTCLQKNCSTFKSHTSRDVSKEATICFVVLIGNMYYISEDARFLQ